MTHTYDSPPPLRMPRAFIFLEKSGPHTLLSGVASSVVEAACTQGAPHAVTASASSVLVGEHTASTRPTYWHGGAPGLKVGELILPPASTGTTITLAAYMDGAEKLRAGYRADRVYVTTQQEAAELYAALYPEGGWVYRVQPWMPLEPDPDCTEPGVSFACLGALIVDAYPPDPLTVVAILTAVLEGDATQDPREARAEVRRLESLLATRKEEFEQLADRLHAEQQAHNETRQLLATSARALEQLRHVEAAGRAVLALCDKVTTIEQQPERLTELDDALSRLRGVLDGVPAAPMPLTATVDEHGMVRLSGSLRIGETVHVPALAVALSPSTPKAPHEAFTAEHALEPEMPGLPGEEDNGHG